MPCRRGHGDEYIKVRPDYSGTYCRWCQSINADRKRHGIEPLPRFTSERRKLKRREFWRACLNRGLSRKMALELAGHNFDCIGNYYNRGAGPEVRRDICEVLRVRESRIWQL